MHHAAILRGMSTGEGAHGRAKYYMHTGYREGQWRPGLPQPRRDRRRRSSAGRSSRCRTSSPIGNRSYGAGFLGAQHQPLVVDDAGPGRREPAGRWSTTSQFEQPRRPARRDGDRRFHREYKADAGSDHQTTYQRAVQLMQSKEAKAFDLSQEPAAVRGRPTAAAEFGEGCLLARRLVEAGVPFVEVDPRRLGHAPGQLRRASRTCRPRSTRPIGALITDLKDRGLLDSTLVIWMGEFGRTPQINSRGASRAATTTRGPGARVLAGGGIKGGQVIGKTDKEGAAVDERPVIGHRLPGHGLQACSASTTPSRTTTHRPAHPHRGQGGQAGPGADRLIRLAVGRVHQGPFLWNGPFHLAQLLLYRGPTAQTQTHLFGKRSAAGRRNSGEIPRAWMLEMRLR